MPSERVQFLTVDEVLAIHERLLQRFGGAAGVRDRGLLESALFRPQTGYYAGLPAMACAMFESLLMNHAFVDGNERVAFFATDVFLRLNGWRLEVDADEAAGFLVGLIDRGEADYERLLPWIRASIRKLPPRCRPTSRET
ncbi:MAG: type II toxin-antitoxin system death-on-curing family toxin [Planctomycetota bacterium]